MNHRREISFDPNARLIEVNDILRCAGRHSAVRAWHFAEECEVTPHGDGLKIVTGRVRVLMEPREPLERVEIHRGGSPQQGGWVSRGFGRKTPTTTVLWHSRVAGDTHLGTRLVYSRSGNIGL